MSGRCISNETEFPSAKYSNMNVAKSLKCGKDLRINSLPNDKILDWPKLKAFAESKRCDLRLENCLQRIENIVGKGGNDGYQHFLFFHQCFQKASFPKSSL